MHCASEWHADCVCTYSADSGCRAFQNSVLTIYMHIQMQTVDIMRFRERLEVKSETTQRMNMTELIALCKER